jgi:DNA mismatch endonuclease, patch repair protein
MQANRGTGTSPELRLRKALHALGFRYVLNSKLPGRPDLVFPSRRVALFVDGCFWHQCPEHAVLPATRREWWKQKLDANVRRDRAADAALVDAGWKVVRVWEHEIGRGLPETVGRITKILRRRGADR